MITNNVKVRPKVAVIGAGIFGVNIAIDLADYADVILYEKNNDIFCEGSFINQFRHHMGYHYPRSDETVVDIQQSSKQFEERYSDALVLDTPTYYALAKKGSLVTAEEFIAFCDKHKLPYTFEEPPAGYLNKKLLDLIIRVPEPSYHFETLRKVASHLLETKSENVDVRLNTRVINCTIDSEGRKVITSTANGVIDTEVVDYVVNATYAHLNDFTQWLRLPPYPIRVDFAEVLIVWLPGPLQSFTVVDGPFATIMPTGNPNEYTLYHAKESILDRYTPSDGLVKNVTNYISKKSEIYNESLLLFPELKNAKILETRIVHRGVLANHEHDDARVADIIMHGSGCWSVLSGKILSSVRTSQRITSFVLDSLEKK